MNQKKSPAYRGALALSFFVPVLVMILVFIGRGIFPFGDASFLRTDLYHQYAPFFQEFRTKLTTGDSLLYSWNIGAGTNFSSLYAYYLASPINWVLLIVPQSRVIEFMTYLIVVKIGLCGLAFTWYLGKHCRTQHFSICFFGIFYALSGYLAAYSWNIMWMDCILIFPVIVLGLERLVLEKKSLLYCVSLGFSILSNYYISIMTCMFLVLYFLVLILTQENKTAGKVFGQLGRFVLYSLLAGGLAAIVLMPEVYALSLTASGDSTFPTKVESYFSIVEMISRHLVAVDTEIGLDHWPNIYCGVAVLMLVPLYVMNRKYSFKEKAGYLFLTFFLLASFSLNVLNYIWHGFHYPNSLPCRQSYLYIFLILVMSFKGLSGIRDRSPRQITTAIWIALGLVVLIQAITTQEDVTWFVIWMSLLFLGIYALLLCLYRRKKTDPILLVVLTMAVILAESVLNTDATSVTTVSRSTYTALDSVGRQILTNADASEKFYRVEKVNRTTKNDGAWLDYQSASTFSSMSYAAMTSIYKALGMEGSTNSYCMNGATPFTESLMSVRYLLSTTQLTDSDLYSQKAALPYAVDNALDNEKMLYLYENEYTLPLGFVVPSSAADYTFGDKSSPFDEQNALVAATTSVTSLFTMQSADASGTQLSFTVSKSGQCYIYVTKHTIKKVSVSHGNFSQTFENVNRGYLLDVGYCEAGDIVFVSNPDSDESISIMAGIFNEEAFKQAYQELSQEPMTVENYSSGHVTASVTTNGGLLVTSIPYDPGWKLKVDGVAVTPSSFGDALLAFDLGAGTHTLEFNYTPQGLRLGFLISAISLLLLIGIVLGQYFYRKSVTADQPDIEVWDDDDDEVPEETADAASSKPLLSDLEPTPAQPSPSDDTKEK